MAPAHTRRACSRHRAHGGPTLRREERTGRQAPVGTQPTPRGRSSGLKAAGSTALLSGRDRWCRWRRSRICPSDEGKEGTPAEGAPLSTHTGPAALSWGLRLGFPPTAVALRQPGEMPGSRRSSAAQGGLPFRPRLLGEPRQRPGPAVAGGPSSRPGCLGHLPSPRAPLRYPRRGCATAAAQGQSAPALSLGTEPLVKHTELPCAPDTAAHRPGLRESRERGAGSGPRAQGVRASSPPCTRC